LLYSFRFEESTGGITVVQSHSSVLVTGAAGFIGSHLVDRLLTEGYEVTAIDNLSTGSLENIAHQQHRRFHFIRGDIRDFNLVRETVKNIDVVFHEAALVSVPLSIKDPLLTNDVNVTGTLNLLKASSDLHVKRFINASSAAVYGEKQPPQKREDMVLSPTSPYGISKLAAENYVSFFHKARHLETVSLRYFNVYGPRQHSNIELGYGSVITMFLNRILNNESPIIHGDGEQTRDFVYVQDVVEANMLALNCKDAAGETFNIGTGLSVSISQIAELLKEITNKRQLKNKYVAPRLMDIRHGYANISKAKKILDYSPKFSIEAGLVELVNWYAKERQVMHGL
jgi:UDP-glucose 4-epimerase